VAAAAVSAPCSRWFGARHFDFDGVRRIGIAGCQDGDGC